MPEFGTCTRFCPASECASRAAHVPFEPTPDLMLKRYARKGAGSTSSTYSTTSILHQDIRTFETLYAATRHLAGLLTNPSLTRSSSSSLKKNSKEESPHSSSGHFAQNEERFNDEHCQLLDQLGLTAQLADFIMDRFRAIRQDFIVQNCENERPGLYLKSLEIQARVLVVLGSAGIPNVDPKFIDDQRQACLSPLLDQSGEFASYECLLNLHSSHFNLLHLVDSVTLMLVVSARLGNYVRFFSVLNRQATPLQRCAAASGIWKVQCRALLTLHKSCRVDTISKGWPKTVLHMSGSCLGKAVRLLLLTQDETALVMKKGDAIADVDVLQRARWDAPWLPDLTSDLQIAMHTCI